MSAGTEFTYLTGVLQFIVYNTNKDFLMLNLVVSCCEMNVLFSLYSCVLYIPVIRPIEKRFQVCPTGSQGFKTTEGLFGQDHVLKPGLRQSPRYAGPRVPQHFVKLSTQSLVSTEIQMSCPRPQRKGSEPGRG